MITVTASKHGSGHTFSVAQDGRPVCHGSDKAFVIRQLRELGVDEPARLVEAARQWGIVEIHDYKRPSK